MKIVINKTKSGTEITIKFRHKLTNETITKIIELVKRINETNQNTS